MRIAHICQSTDPAIGGSLSVARALTQEQRKLGHEAWSLFLYPNPQMDASPVCRDYEILCNIARPSRWTVGSAALYRRLKRLDPDLIHHHDGILWPRLVTARLNRILVTHGHLGAPRCSVISNHFWTHRYISRQTDCLIAISPWVADSWIAAGFPGEKIRVIANGVDCNRFTTSEEQRKKVLRSELGLPSDTKIVLWIGRLDRRWKGLDRVVSLASDLDAGCKLVIVGDGPDRTWLEHQIDKFPNKPRPVVKGKVVDPTKYYGASDVLLFTSRIEPFGLVLLEAAASGLPIFAFACEGGGNDLLCQLGAVVARDGESAWLARCIRDENTTERSAAAMEVVRARYSWNFIARQIVQVYGELLT